MDLINFNAYPVKNVLPALLKDKTTKQNIIFATDAYSDYKVDAKTQISVDLILGFDSFVIQPRVLKSMKEQTSMTAQFSSGIVPCK